MDVSCFFAVGFQRAASRSKARHFAAAFAGASLRVSLRSPSVAPCAATTYVSAAAAWWTRLGPRKWGGAASVRSGVQSRKAKPESQSARAVGRCSTEDKSQRLLPDRAPKGVEMADRSIGIMDPAYFVGKLGRMADTPKTRMYSPSLVIQTRSWKGRRELLDWINTTLQLNLTKIEQTASGAVACQLMDAIFPGSVPMHKVNWEAKQDFQFVPNYKLLQKSFRLNQISRHVDVPKLIRAKYQDNLEFMQWFKAFFESQHVQEDYDPVAARAAGRGGRRANTNLRQDAKVASQATATSRRAPKGVPTPPRPSSNKENRSRRTAPASGAGVPAPPVAATDPLRKRVEELEGELATKNQELAEAEAQIETIDGEREFYYKKLLAVESMLQEEEGKVSAGAAVPPLPRVSRRQCAARLDANRSEAHDLFLPRSPCSSRKARWATLLESSSGMP
eukprot:scaffold1806_cov240-Pinguiococcus_pyrenoidosus.AAC.11